MAIKFNKRYFTPDELIQRWQCSELSLRNEVIEGALRPSIFVNRPADEVIRDGHPIFDPNDEAYIDPYSEPDELFGPRYLHHGYLVLRMPVRDGLDSCTFYSFSHAEDYEEKGELAVLVAMAEFGFPLEKYWGRMVFDLTSVRRFEDERTEPLHIAPARKDSLTTTERNTLLKLVIGMAIKGYTYQPDATRGTVPAEIASDLAALGIPVSDDTVRKWLKEAAAIVLPGSNGRA